MALAASAPQAPAGYGTLADGKAAPPGSPQAKAKATSEAFEAVFLSSMFNQMFSGLQGDGPMGGAGGAGVWRSFLADEYAKSFAKAGGVGIGAEVYRTLLSLQEAKS